MQKEIKKTWYFPQSPEEVWEYLTNPELIELWLAKTDFKPIAGNRFQFTNSCDGGDRKPHFTFCKVLEIVPCKLLSYSWQKGVSEDAITLDSVVTWTLTGKDGGTQLHLQHNGFYLLEDVMAHTNGWNGCLNKIIALINTASHATSNA